MTIVDSLKEILAQSGLTSEEARAFELGLGYLSQDEQQNFAEILGKNPDLIYPIYINFKAKLKAMEDDDAAWEKLVEEEIKEFEKLLEKRKDGDKIS